MQYDSSFGIIVYKHKVLVILRDNKPTIPSPNTWQFIGGGPEPNETPDETLIREIKEETNIDITDYKFLTLLKMEEGDKHIYQVKLNEQQFNQIKLGNEGQKLEFFCLEELKNLKLSRTTQYLVDNYYESLRDLI